MSATTLRATLALLLLLMVGFTLDARRGSLAGPDTSLTQIQKAGVLRVGIDPTYPPFAVTNGQGELEGFEVDLARELAQRLDVQPDFVGVDVGGMIEGLIARKFDVAISGIVPSPDYGRRVAFSQPYYDAGLVLVLRPSVDPSALAGRPLAIEVGSEADARSAELRAQLREPMLVPLMDVEEMERRLASGGVDGAIVDRLLASELAKKVPGLTVGEERLTNDPFVVAVRASDNALREALDDALTVMELDGTLAKLEARWLR